MPVTAFISSGLLHAYGDNIVKQYGTVRYHMWRVQVELISLDIENQSFAKVRGTRYNTAVL